MSDNLDNTMQTLGQRARYSAHILANTNTETKNEVLKHIANAIRSHNKTIEEANRLDKQQAKANGRNKAFIERLHLDKARIQAMAKTVEQIAAQPDPVGRTLAEWQQPNGLHFSRVSVPLGVLGVIYESRPNVTVDAAALCLKSGNAVILRAGSDSQHSVKAIVDCIEMGLNQIGVSPHCVQRVPTIDRKAVSIMLAMDKWIDVIVPRGGKSLIERISQESRIPLFKHLEGICHTYIHKDAKPEMAAQVIQNAKMRRPGICGATETVLIDKAILNTHLPLIIETLNQARCEIHADETIVALDNRTTLATKQAWDTEYLDAVINLKSVQHIDEAITHIERHGSHHTDAIITENPTMAEKFLNQVDSAIVMHNTSTQFADGGEFGMGAEIGIATGKLHARGPVGLEQLTTFKYKVKGAGQVREG